MDKSHHASPTDALSIFLRRLNIKHTNYTIEQFEKHPDFPSILSFSYVFEKLGLETAALRSSYNQMKDDLPKPLLVHTRDNGGMYLVVDNLDDEKVQFASHKNKVETQTKGDFLNSWTGILMVANKPDNLVEENYKKNRINDFIKQVKYFFIWLSLILVITYYILNGLEYREFFDYLFLFTKALGICITIPLIIQLIDKENTFINKLCQIGSRKSNGNCLNILESPGAQIFNVFTWSEIGFLYFLSLFSYILFFPRIVDISLIAILAIVVSPYIIYSIYYQWKIAKNWCRLCLFVQGILVLELLIALSYCFIFHRTFFNIQEFYSLGICVLSLMTIFILLKPILIDWNKYKNQIPKIAKIKLNSDVFHAIRKDYNTLKKIPKTAIYFGNPKGDHHIVLITNPTCQSCISLHTKLAQILKTKSNTWVETIFLIELDVNGIAYQITNCMLALNEKYGNIVAGDYISEYYTHYSMKPKEWLNKYSQKISTKTPIHDKLIQTHTEWCIENQLLATPVIFYQKKVFPQEYTIDDLDYMID